jgi:hypothetical protein
LGTNAGCDSLDGGALRNIVARTLPLADVTFFPVALEKIGGAIGEYIDLKAAAQVQLTAEQIRGELNSGLNLFSKLENWMMEAEGSVVRDYVLSAMGDSLRRQDQTKMPWHIWKGQVPNIREWKSWVDKALSLVQSDRGKPENFPLKQLVRDLAKIWEEYTARPFTNTQKGQQRARDFVMAICRMPEPDLTDGQIETAIRFAVRKTPGGRRGRKSPPGSTE